MGQSNDVKLTPVYVSTEWETSVLAFFFKSLCMSVCVWPRPRPGEEEEEGWKLRNEQLCGPRRTTRFSNHRLRLNPSKWDRGRLLLQYEYSVDVSDRVTDSEEGFSTFQFSMIDSPPVPALFVVYSTRLYVLEVSHSLGDNRKLALGWVVVHTQHISSVRSKPHILSWWREVFPRKRMKTSDAVDDLHYSAGFSNQ